MRNYDELIGKEFTIVRSDGSTFQARVKMLDLDVGITVVWAKDPEQYVLCTSVLAEGLKSNRAIYAQTMAILRGIRLGTFHAEICEKIDRATDRTKTFDEIFVPIFGISQKDCVFGR